MERGQLWTKEPLNLVQDVNKIACAPFIIILRGPPASGKTSVSLVLRDQLTPAARLSIDVLRYLVTPRNLSTELLRAIKINAANVAVSFAQQGISSIIESTFVSKEIIDEMCAMICSHGFSPNVFTLIIDEETTLSQNLQRELYYQMDQARIKELYQNYNWNIGKKIYVKSKEIEEVAADIRMHLETKEIAIQHTDGDRFILFLRHGQAPNHEHVFLSDDEKALSSLGEYQAISIAPTITLFKPDAIFCSPYLRTVTTSKLACKTLSQQINLRPGLIERSFPMLYGKTREEIASLTSPEIADQLGRCSDLVELPGCETLFEAQQRVVQEIRAILDQGSKRILVVSHGGPHSWLCCHYLGLDLSYARCFSLNEAHVSLFQFDRFGTFKRIVCINALALPPEC